MPADSLYLKIFRFSSDDSPLPQEENRIDNVQSTINKVQLTMKDEELYFFCFESAISLDFLSPPTIFDKGNDFSQKATVLIIIFETLNTIQPRAKR